MCRTGVSCGRIFRIVGSISHGYIVTSLYNALVQLDVSNAYLQIRYWHIIH
uniref:Uncharacterized protein n=1 Tax=Babesia bovis TaxID=5865 RepID=S6CAR3_BABBO|nr:hypothetical protein [Babesia bovis]